MDTKAYLKNVVDLEGALYTLNKSIGYLKYGQRNLGISKNYESPQVPEDTSGFVVLVATVVFDFFIGGILGLIIGFYNLMHGNGFWLSFWACIFIVGIILLIIVYLGFTYSDKGAHEAYEKKLDEYERLVSQDSVRVNKELKKKKNIDLQILALQNKQKEMTTTLRKLYEMNVLYPKYRNFIAAATFLEYFDSGRCNSLEGHEGAYNIFENELRLNAILGKLDDIINHLDEIRTSQYAIYNAISEGNKTANAIYQNSVRISDNMNSITDNSAIAAYNSEITAKNSEILKFIAIYDHI